MIEFLSSRSRRQTALRCARARYLLDEAFGHGWEPVKLAVPLLTGGSVHKGLASLLIQSMGGLSLLDIDAAVYMAIKDYESRCTGRQLDLEQLESQSYVYNEQKALTEALVRLAGLRVVPKLLEQYEVLEVERMDKAVLVQNFTPQEAIEPDDASVFTVLFRSIPDALLRARATGDLYVLSWKTTTEYDQRKDEAARVDMQGLSEPWALERRLGSWWETLERMEDASALPQWFLDLWGTSPKGTPAPTVRGVQMVYLCKGARRKMSKGQMEAEGLSAEQIAAGGEMKKHACPLIYGYKKESAPGLSAPEFATSADWHCSKPHPMRRSQWYPTGECSGDGRLHKRGDDWKSFPVWSSGGVKAWMDKLAAGEISPEAGDALDQSYAIPVPHFRTRESTAAWLRQTRAAERRNAQDLLFLRGFEEAIRENPNDSELWETFQAHLDETFPQTTEKCGDWFHRRCPCFPICHEGVRDPVGSGLFQVKTQYEPSAEGGE